MVYIIEQDVPVILIDMDGPLANFDKMFWDCCESAGFIMEGTRETQVKRFASAHVASRDQRKVAREWTEQQGWFRDLEPTEGAVDGFKHLAELADLWICTKPLETNPWCRDEKAEWIQRYLGPEWLRKLIITPNKGLVRGNLLLDDAIKEEWLHYAEWLPVVFPMPWNADNEAWKDMERWDWTKNPEELVDLARSNTTPRI